jgi:hypothetical protein
MMMNNKLFFKLIPLIFLIFSIGLFSCDPPKEESQTEKFEKDLKSFNNKMDNIGQTMEILDAMQNELDDLEQLRMDGKISDTEYSTRSNEIKETFGRALAQREKVAPATGLPQWAKNLSLTEPVGLILDPGYSQITSVENNDEGFNSVLLVYSGSYELAMNEAERIAKQARIPISKDYLDAKEITETYGSTPIKGIAYMNFDPFVKDAAINISITVDETGILTISAVDVEQMKRQFERARPAEN